MALLHRLFKTEREKTLYLLSVVLIHNLIYPLSRGPGLQPLLFYAFFSTMFVVAVFVLSAQRTAHLAIALTGLVVFVAGVTNAYASNPVVLMTLYLSVILYHLVMMGVLARYVFVAEDVLMEVILAATSLYLIIGSIFTAFYGLIEWLAPGSFVASSGAAIEWQQLLYYSYVTLTTLGYGDIIPVKFYAQSFATFEAVLGVLYTVILLSRLVGLYEADKV